jgi:tetratricopeptide (TPR) repeat protein
VSTLPRGMPSFTGRAPEVKTLIARIADQEGATAVHVVTGMPGVGKTALAVHVAHKVADRFPDGHLFLELRGHTPGQQPLAPVDALRSLLLAIGVPARHIPPGLDDRARLWRDRLAGKKMLLLLDDAADHGQVRPLLPGTEGCQVVLTTRRRLPGLEDAHPLPLAVLGPDQAVGMFLRLTARRDDDPERVRVAELVRVCGYLPLAISLVAGRLRSHPSWDVRYLTDMILSAPNRLTEMCAHEREVTTAFELSYRDLSSDVRRLFRRLSCHPGLDFDLYAATALSGEDPGTTRRLLETLYLDNLTEEPSPGRYRMHALVRHYAESLVVSDPVEDPDAVAERILDYYLHVATQAARLLPHHDPGLDPVGRPPAHTPVLATEDDAAAWFARERRNLNGCVEKTSGRYTVRLAAALHPYLTRHGHWDDALTVQTTAVLTAERVDDRPGLAVALRNLAAVQVLVDDYASAMVNASRAQRVCIQLGDRGAEAVAIEHIGVVQYALGEYGAATRNLTRALKVYTEVGNRFGEASARYRLGIVQHLTDSYSASSLSLVRSFTAFHQLGCRQGQANALSYLGLLQGMAGDHAPALRCLTRAVALFAEISDRRGEAVALYRMGTLLRVIGEHTESLATQVRAHTLFVDLGSYRGQAHTLCGLAMSRYLAGDRTYGEYALAVDTLERALTLCGQIGDRLCEAGIYNQLGVLHHLAGHCEDAAASLVRSLTLCMEIGDPTGTVEALNNLGRLAWEWPEAGDAFSYHQRALRLAREIGALVAEGRALEWMGRCLIQDSYAGCGRAYLREALDLYERLGLPDALGVKAALAALA